MRTILEGSIKMQMEPDRLMLTWPLSSASLAPLIICSAHNRRHCQRAVGCQEWEPNQERLVGEFRNFRGPFTPQEQGLICAVHSGLLNQSSGWHSKNVNPSCSLESRGGVGGSCLHSVSARFSVSYIPQQFLLLFFLPSFPPPPFFISKSPSLGAERCTDRHMFPANFIILY